MTPKSDSSFKIAPKRSAPAAIRSAGRLKRSNTIIADGSALMKSLGSIMNQDFFKRDKSSMFKNVKSNYSMRALERKSTCSKPTLK